MTEKNNWSILIGEIEHILKLKTFPVGVKFLEDGKETEKIGKNKLRHPNKNSFTCQLITLARTYKYTFHITEGCLSPACANVMGFKKVPEIVADGTLHSLAWTKTKEEAAKFETAMSRLPLKKYSGILVGPQALGLFEPDVVLFYGNPAQMMFIINALQFEDYEKLTFDCVGESSTCSNLIQSILDGKPSLCLPCYAERRFGHAQDDEMSMIVPRKQVEKVRRNLLQLFKRGIRYPIAYFGAGVDTSPGLPTKFRELLDIT